ncbi:MAG: mannitol dehydrogenase family protein [Edaphobacter sp.]|uniref:mannitol dehydrogenase family protein n=1 Tax=Edaphobacter sp. TaxID=1934404 RepID=UPI002394F5D9|nr:mannitol dehydrogenase family protein [Edaphobacter sp.]MDE1176376.1 mannitol dehydrogenase family protein [Edaphobacter sp.]
MLQQNEYSATTLQDVRESIQLSHGELGRLPAGLRRPGFDPADLKTGVLHLGCGNFHRAHQAVATQAAIEAEGRAGLRWGIASVSMRSPEVAQILTRQNGLYTVLQCDSTETEPMVVGSIVEAVFSPNDSRGLAARMANPDIALVTLTVTADGYHLEPSTCQLISDHPHIIQDLSHLSRPKTAVGALVSGLALIRERGGKPPVILSCDNLSANGSTLRQAVLDFASLVDDRLSAWIAGNVSFPNTMVDRIVPMTKAEDIAEAQELLGGMLDEAPVPTEPWFQWVIEDFDGPRPLWEAGGARFVTDVAPFELAKLRMLNGTHMLLAYVGALAGKNTVAEAAGDRTIGTLALRFMQKEQAAHVPFPSVTLDQYAKDLMQRFRNPAIVHMIERIGRNGSGKIATRVLEPMRQNLEAGIPVQGAMLLIASWIRWFALHEQDELDVQLVDPRADELRRICREASEDFRAQAEAFLSMEEIFGPPLPDHDRIVAEIGDLMRRLAHEPVAEVLADLARKVNA